MQIQDSPIGHSEASADKLLAYFKGAEVELSDSAKERADQIRKADEMMSQHRHAGTVTKLLMELYGIHKEKAWRIIQEAEYIFGITRPINKDYAKRLMADSIWRRINALEKQNDIDRIGDKDFKLNGKTESHIQQYYKLLIDIYGFKMTDPELIDPDLLTERSNVLVINVGEKAATINLDRYNTIPPKEREELLKAMENGITYDDFEEIEPQADDSPAHT